MESYGGLWLSPGTIPMKKDYSSLLDVLNQYELVTFGSLQNTLSESYTYKPNHYIIGAIFPITLRFKSTNNICMILLLAIDPMLLEI